MEPQRNYCRRYLLGTCKFGDKCRYLHQQLPNNLCKYYTLTGSCIHGKKCVFVHDDHKSTAFNGKAAYPPVEESKTKSDGPAVLPATNGLMAVKASKLQEEGKIVIKAPPKLDTRTPFIKQGLRPEEKELFDKNKLEWASFPGYLDYLRSLKEDCERDIAQVLRKYQYSFTRTASPVEGVTSFSLKHTPSCVREELPFYLEEEYIDLAIEVNKGDNGAITFAIRNKIDAKVAEELAKLLKQISQKINPPKLFNTLKYLDNALPQLCTLAIKKALEEPQKEKSELIEEQKEPEDASWESPEENSSEEDKGSEDEEEDKTETTTTSDQSVGDIYRNANKVRILTDVVEMRNISIAYVNYLVLQAMCCQCKTEVQANLTAPSAKSDTLVFASECIKCGNTLAAAYKFVPVHMNNKKDLGYIGLVGLEIKDILPCNFKIQCGGCDSMAKAQHVQAALDSYALCGKCGKNMKFNISKYQMVKSSWEGTDKALVSSKMKATANANMKKDRAQKIKPGQPLPDYGTCKHYKKSYRWFRFPCCGKAYPCDICHDDAEDHISEKAKSIICGYCSTEQAAHITTCNCGKALVNEAKGKMFWEGGKGCRDRTKMSRKDARKYKRTPAEKKA